MDYALLPSAVGAPVCAFLALLFLTTAVRGYRPASYGALGWLAFLGAGHLAAYFVLRTAQRDSVIILGTKLVTAGTLLMAPAWVQLILAFIEKRSRRLLPTLYLVSVGFCALLGTGLLLRDEVVSFGKLGIERQAAPGPLYTPHLVYFAGCVVLGLVLLARCVQKTHRSGAPLPGPLADTFSEEGVPIIVGTVAAAALIGIIDAIHLLGFWHFQLPIELGELFLIAGSAYAITQRFPRLLLRIEGQLQQVKGLNQELEARNRQIEELARKNEELLNEEIRSLRTELATAEGVHFGEMIGASPAMRRLFEMIARVAPHEATVIILGESGTGKERIAREIHRLSQRAGGPFFAVNAAALTETLLESELFGHLKGAFTGAISDRPGIFQAAHGGTLFLDEVGDINPALQIKLLRVLEEREVTPVGGVKPVPVDVRIVAATNRNLEDEVKTGRFREDLFYRLNVVALEVPPLRERTDDIPLLVSHFLKCAGERMNCLITGVSSNAAQILSRHGWPGNVRELENVIERAVTLCQGEVIRSGDLPPSLVQAARFELRDLGLGEETDRAASVVPATTGPQEEITLEELERRYIVSVLKRNGWERGRVSAILGINPSTLYRKLKAYGISPPASDEEES